MPLFKTVEYKLIPEGIQVLKIVKCDFDTDFGVIKLTVENSEGIKHTETFFTLYSDGTENVTAKNIFHYIAKVAMNNFDLGDFDTDDLVGKYFRCNVGRRAYTDKQGNEKTTVSFGEKSPATGFDDTSSDVVDLDSFLDI